MTLKDYKNIFVSDGQQEVVQYKILIKGEPGMGKTTLGEESRVGLVHEEFSGMFSIIFFVFLKFVQPNETNKKGDFKAKS